MPARALRRASSEQTRWEEDSTTNVVGQREQTTTAALPQQTLTAPLSGVETAPTVVDPLAPLSNNVVPPPPRTPSPTIAGIGDTLDGTTHPMSRLSSDAIGQVSPTPTDDGGRQATTQRYVAPAALKTNRAPASAAPPPQAPPHLAVRPSPGTTPSSPNRTVVALLWVAAIVASAVAALLLFVR